MSYRVHSLNNSPGKQKYSFGKASRFQPYKAMTDCSYLPNVDKDRRSAIIGYGERSLDSDKFHKIYPHAYDIPSSITKNQGNSFKAGRHEIGGPLESVKYGKSLPGPANYGLPSTLQRNGASLRPRLADMSLKYIKQIPGPGAYYVPSSISNGQKNPFQSKFSVGGGPRIPAQGSYSLDIRKPTYEKKQVPGPGQYDLQKYGVSNPETISYRKNGVAKFGRQARQSLENKNSKLVPGPGQQQVIDNLVKFIHNLMIDKNFSIYIYINKNTLKNSIYQCKQYYQTQEKVSKTPQSTLSYSCNRSSNPPTNFSTPSPNPNPRILPNTSRIPSIALSF